MTRLALGKKRRFDVFKRDAFACQYCGAHPPTAVLEIDHIVAVSAGGTNEIENLITACFDCNRGKGAISLTTIPESLSDKAAQIAEREAQLLGYQAILDKRRRRLFEETCQVLTVVLENSTEITNDRFFSTREFIDKLGFHVVLAAAEKALAARQVYESQRFRYFCGICWSRIRGGT